MQRAACIVLLGLSALSSSARLQPRSKTQAHTQGQAKVFPPTEGYAGEAAEACFKALGVEDLDAFKGENGLATFKPHFLRAMENPAPEEHIQSIFEGTRGACVRMLFQSWEWDANDVAAMAAEGGSYVDAIVEKVIKEQDCEIITRTRGLGALFKIFSYLDDKSKVNAMNAFVYALKDESDMLVWWAGLALDKVLPTLSSLPSNLLPAMKIAAEKAKEENDSHRMSGVLYAMQGLEKKLLTIATPEVEEIVAVVKAAADEHGSDFAQIYEDLPFK